MTSAQENTERARQRGERQRHAADLRHEKAMLRLWKKAMVGGGGKGRSIKTLNVYSARPTRKKSIAGRASKGQGSWIKSGRSPILLAQIHKGNIKGIKYGFKEKGALNLDTNLLSNTPDDQTEEMLIDARKHPRCKAENIFKHWSISLHPSLLGLSHAEWQQIARAHLRKCGFFGCGYTVLLHPKDEDHAEHIHIVASRSKADGKLVNMSNDRWKFRAACREIETDMNLQPVSVSSETPLAPTTRAVSAQRMAQRLGIQQDVWVKAETVLDCLRESTSMAQFERGLAAHGIQMQSAKRATDGVVTGVLFRRDAAVSWLAGSTLSRSLSLPRLQAQIKLNRTSLQKTEQELHIQRERQRQAAQQRPEQKSNYERDL